VIHADLSTGEVTGDVQTALTEGPLETLGEEEEESSGDDSDGGRGGAGGSKALGNVAGNVGCGQQGF
jgi:hypothetical protein